MPAVQLSRLKEQIQLLATTFDQPENFLRGVKGVFEQYADHTFRPAQTVKKAVLAAPSYHAPAVVVNQLELAIHQWAQIYPVESFATAQALWQDNMLEMRVLGGSTLGSIPAEYNQQVVRKIIDWTRPGEDRILLELLFDHATRTLRQRSPHFWLEQIRAWMLDPAVNMQRIGLLALLPLVNDRAFENLPAVYNSLGPVLQENPKALQSELKNILVALALRSPTETLYFLKQMFGLGASEDLLRLIRRSLPDFPPSVQEKLRDSLRSQQRLG